MERGGRNDSRLSHCSAEVVLPAACVPHQLVRTGDQRPERAAETLGEAERDRVEAAPDPPGLHAARHGGVDEPCSIEMNRELVLATGREDRVELVQRPPP